MTKRSWFRQLFARPVTRSIRQAAARCRPHLEVLEARLAPAAYHVTSLSDDGSAGTLRWAITQANANASADTIDFQVTGAISLNGSQLPAFTDAATTTVIGPSGGITLDAHGASRIFGVNAGATVGLDRLTLANGSALDGGGIYNQGTLALTNVTLAGNTAAFAGGFTDPVVGGNGGGIRNDGTLSLTDCTLSGNSALDGGGVWNAGTLALTNVTLAGNTAAGTVVVVIDGGVFSGEVVGGNGGGIRNDGTLSLTNCTLSGNSAVGNPFFGGGIGGGIYNAADLTLNNSIVANSPGGGDISGASSGGHNLFGSVPLGPLADNGGPTQTLALPAGSLAIDAADPSLAPAADQRGLPRDAAPDIGAFEVGHNFVVTTLADEEDGGIDPSLGAGTSLREAIAFANQSPGADSITFAVSGTISLNGSQLPTITDDLTVAGPTAGLTVDAHGASRIFGVNAGATVGLDRLTLANGSALDGGGIYNQGTLALTNVTLAGNTAAFAGGFTDPVVGGNGGGIRNDGTLSLTDCTLSGNSALDGGGVWNAGTLALTNVTLAGNTAAGTVVVVIDGGVFSGEVVGGNGGGIRNDGTLSLTNCTLSGNSAVGNPFFGGGIGGGIYNAADLTLNNSIVANSPGGGDISGASSGGHNLFGSVPLGPLADNGGPTQTLALPAGSLAIDAGSNTLVLAGLTTDQRGFARISGAAVDIGAYEVQGPSLTPAALPDGTYGTAYTSQPLAVTEAPGGAGGPYTFAVTAGSLPTGLNLDGTAGTLSGTPTAVGADTFTVTATDSAGFAGSQGYALTIDKAALTITANNTGKTYGQALTFAGTEFTARGLLNGDTISTVKLTNAGAAANAGVTGSPYAIAASTAVGSGLDNYTISYVSGLLTISPATLTITATNQTRFQGEANPAFTVRYSGFVLGEGPGVLGGTLSFSTPASASSPPGSYAITPAGLTSGNYAITFVSGTLTVLSYSQVTSNLQAQVDAAGLDHGTQNSLDSQLKDALAAFNRGNTKDGTHHLGDFIHHVSAQRGKHITAALADAWIALAQRIIDAVG